MLVPEPVLAGHPQGHGAHGGDDPRPGVRTQIRAGPLGDGRAELRLRPGAAEDEARAAALADPVVQRAMAGKPPRRVIVVPDKIVNVVVA